MFAVSIYGLERCPGASKESQEDFKWKYDVAQIVAYGTVSNVQKNTATLQVSCTLKGQLPVSTVELTQLGSYISYFFSLSQYLLILRGRNELNGMPLFNSQ
jgi:hypothetical protein